MTESLNRLGKIQEALELINSSFPDLLYQEDQESMQVTFDLKCQQVHLDI